MRHPAFLLTLLLLCLPRPAFAANAIGAVSDLIGQVTIHHPGQAAPAALKNDAPVYSNDVIETGDASHVAVKFIDGTAIVLGPKGSLSIDDYVYAGPAQAGNRGHYTILKTAFLFVDGALGKVKLPDVKINVDYGAIGIRGTKLWRGMRSNECWIYLESGVANVSNGGGEIGLQPGQMTRMTGRDVKPTMPDVWQDSDISWIKKALGEQ